MISYKKRAVEGYRNLVKKRDQSHLNSVCNGRFQKKTIPLHEWLFGIPRARGGSLNWKSEGMGEYLRLEFRRHWGEGGLRLEFSQGTDESVFLEKANFMDFNNQLAN